MTDVLVVVPARDEAEALQACLAALDAAARRLLVAPDPPRVHRVVVLDRCTDGSAAVVAAWPGVVALTSSSGTAGGARALGVAAGLDALAADGTPPERVWVACTDADSAVPPGWLAHHVATARSGADLLLGTVDLPGGPGGADGLDLPDGAGGLARAWSRRYALRDGHGHGHVHATNLGVRASTYRDAGGFAAVATHEDVGLARAAAAAGARVVRSAREPVTTSARLTGRAPGGFADHLAALVAEAR